MSDTLIAIGQVHFVGEVEEFGTNGFRKRLLVLAREVNTDWPQYVPFEFVQKNCEKLDTVIVGQQATVSFNLRGNENNGRFYPSLQGWKIDVAEMAGPPQQAPPPPAPPVAAPAPVAEAQPTAGLPEDDDLPF